MSIQQAAQAAQIFPDTTVSTSHGVLPLRVVLTSIAGSESDWDATADGDCGLGGPACGTCSGDGQSATSWGMWQIHNVHSAYLAQQTGSSNPCIWRQWLFNPANNAKAALSIYQSQGLGAWSTYNDGSWAQHITDAQSALAAIAYAKSATVAATGPGIYAYNTPSSRSATPVLVLASLVAAGTIAAVEMDVHWGGIRQWFRAQVKHGTIATKESD